MEMTAQDLLLSILSLVWSCDFEVETPWLQIHGNGQLTDTRQQQEILHMKYKPCNSGQLLKRDTDIY